MLIPILKKAPLGRGTFGTVHKAQWRGIVVAVKHMNTQAERETLESEISILSRIRHENIVRLYGHSRDHSILIMEYAEGGNLYDVLHSIKLTNYSIDHALSWAYQTAKGVSYLHRLGPKPLVHRDIKPPNLLLQDYCRRIKICDFGTACDARTHMTTNQGSVMWMAPEVFQSNQYTEKCDVFSWAITFWEILARQKPFSDPNMSPYAIMWATCSGTRPHKLQNCPKFLEDLIIQCWDTQPDKRPSMVQIEKLMEKIERMFVSHPLSQIELPENRIARMVSEANDCESDLSYPDQDYAGYENNFTQTEPPRNPLGHLFSRSQVIPFNMGTEPTRSREDLIGGIPRRISRDDRVNHTPPVPSRRPTQLFSQSNPNNRPQYSPLRYISGNILASGYYVAQSMKPIQPDRAVPRSVQVYQEHCEKLSEFVRLDLEYKFLQQRNQELQSYNITLPTYEEEISNNNEEIKQLETLNHNLLLQVERLKLKQKATTAAAEGGWVFL